MDAFVSLILLNAYLIIGTYCGLEDSRRSLDAGAGSGLHPRHWFCWRGAVVPCFLKTNKTTIITVINEIYFRDSPIIR